MVAGILAGVLLVVFVAEPLPTDGGDGARLFDATGDNEFAQLATDFVRRDVALGEVPQHTINAVLAAEDADFYSHRGISIPGVLRALEANLRSGGVSQGGSTITQQYIKVVSRDDAQTVWRKVREAALAIKLERTYSKDEILQRYLNVVYFGRGAYGIQAAAQAYFGVDASQLSLVQSALLAGVLPAPSRYDPLVDPQASQTRYAYVLGRMVEEGWLDLATQSQVLLTPPGTVPRQTSVRDDVPWFTGLVRQELDQLGFADGRGLEVTTTLNLGLQRHAEQAYQQTFSQTTASGALVAVAPSTGGVLAVVGGKDYATDQLNLATASRQPGSTFKAFALAAWLADGRSPETTFEAPGQIDIAAADGGSDWHVENYGGTGAGTLTLRQATWRSTNTVYAQMATQLGVDRVATTATALLGRDPSAAFTPVPSLVLGTEEVTPLELAGAYATLADGGRRHDVHTIIQVRRGEEVLYTATDSVEQVVSPDVAYATTEVLRGVISQGTGQAAGIGRPAAGKTGTTQDYGDAWFAGYTPQVAAVVWMGNRDNRDSLPDQETGGGAPARTWAAFMSAVHEGLDVLDFPPPDAAAFGDAPSVTAPTVEPTPSASPTPTPTTTSSEDPQGSEEPTEGASGPPVPSPVPSSGVPATSAPTPATAPPQPGPTQPPGPQPPPPAPSGPPPPAAPPAPASEPEPAGSG